MQQADEQQDDPSSGQPLADLSVAVIGAGFSGLAMAIELLRDGDTDFLIFDRGTTVGGTWRDNDYPGCACDVNAHLYCYSYAPNPNWDSTYATQPEVLDYLKRCSTKFGVDPYIRFEHELLDASWDESSQRWRIKTSQGDYTARVLVLGTGYLSEPEIPELEGLNEFQGEMFHSSRWNHDFDMKAKRVAVIGTGASAIQFVPEIQPKVERLDVYQRTAPWVVPKHSVNNPGIRRWALNNIPGYQRFWRECNKWGLETFAYAMARPKIMTKVQKIGTYNLNKYIKDPELRQKLTPESIIGCKRILYSDKYYPAINNPNVEIVTDGIARITATGIETTDGAHREVDAILFGTGFKPTNLPVANLLHGRNGDSLSDVWADSQVAYLGSTVPGFPNMFMMLGPSTTLTHSSMTLMVEAQASYIADFLRTAKKEGIAAVDVKPARVKSYRDRVDGYLKGSVWSGGRCASWYFDAKGQNTTLWPTYSWRFRKLTRRFVTDDYEVIEAQPAPTTPHPHLVGD